MGRWDMGSVPLERAREVATGFVGPIEQVPPMVSAVQVGGRRLHELARAGVEVERRPRRVVVHRFEVAATGEPGVVRIEVECSSGTYVRSLAADLGAALGGGAHLRALRRTAIGSFGVGEARPVEALSPAAVLPPAEAMRDYQRVEVEAGLVTAIGHGQVLGRDQLGLSGTGPWGMVDADGCLVAVYEAVDADRAKPAVVLAA